jgi:peptidoglycan hydrolase-like protein with peptidoglycan-binding domain
VRVLREQEAGPETRRPPAPRAPGHPAIEQMLTLQRRAGNRAAQAALLQRQEADEPAGPLDAKQVAAAIRFHARQPERYTAAILQEIQVRLGVEVTGVADAATVQAIATFQQTEGTEFPELKVDGMAGPRTLPRMFPTGLKAPGEGQKFGEEAQTEVIDRWQQLTPKQRAEELVRLVNVHLEAVGVPAVTPNPIDTGTNLGTFDFPTWSMEVGVAALSIVQPDRAQAADVVDTIYHEARHAEQWFRIAQLRVLQRGRRPGAAADERLAKAIATELGIPKRIADRAVADPPRFALGSMDALIAQGWFDSVYGVGRDRRNATLTELERSGAALEQAKKRFADNPTPQNQAALDRANARRTKALDGHAQLPEENDAFPTGASTGAGVTRGAPPPPPAPGPGGAASVIGPSQLDGLEAALSQLTGTPVRA